MGAEVLDIWNLAVSHLGIGKEIGDVDERTPEAQACNRFWEKARDEVLRDHDWPFAKKKAALVLVSESEDDDHPDTNFDFAYRYPSDCLKVRRIDSGVRTDYRSARVSFDLMADDQGTLILTDKEEAYIEYTSTDAQNPARWHADFVMAVSYRLAAYIASRLTKGDPFKVGQVAMAFFRMSIVKAKANAANEVQADEDPDSALIIARN